MSQLITSPSPTRLTLFKQREYPIHCADIKPENVMCQTSKSTNIKIIDFGLATKLDPNELVKISTGTAEFAAPEIVEREPVGFYTDMWSIGVLAYVLLSGMVGNMIQVS